MARSSLQQALDREVYQAVTSYLQRHDESARKVQVRTIYDHIAQSNSSLRRKSKQQLEASIERALDELREVEMSSDYMNDQIVQQWGTATANGTKSKKRDGDKREERESKKRKKSEAPTAATDSSIDTSPPQGVTLEDLGGVDKVKTELMEHLMMALLRPEAYAKRRIPIPRGILLHGPPGCGKTAICRAFAAEMRVPFIEILGPSVVSGVSGDSEKQIREHFEKAKEVAPCLIFIDEIDVIAPKRDDAHSQMEKRIVAQLLISMDSLAMETNESKPVIVLAATNRPDSLDPALRRGGRFGTEISMGIPNQPMREMILRSLARQSHFSADVDFGSLAKKTAGFVGADLKDLVSKAGTWSMAQYRKALIRQVADKEIGTEIDQNPGADWTIKRYRERLVNTEMSEPPGFDDTAISMEAFDAVLPNITPSSKREGFSTVPDVTWKDVGALAEVRKKLNMAIVEAIHNPERYAKVGLKAPNGVLLFGPPGCGKTLLAKAVAAESKANFISVKGPELLSKYFSESERAVRQLFMRARSSAPCIIFFDEFDAIAPKRSADGHEASARVVNTLLTELDGINTREGIYVIAATNRQEMIDDAMLRPGRFETRLYVGLPEPEERVDILKALIQQQHVIDIKLAKIGRCDDCAGFSGADLEALLRRAGEHALWRDSEVVEEVDIQVAARDLEPSVKDIRKYMALHKKM